MTDQLVDRWAGERRERFMGDDEPTTIDGIVLPPRDEHHIRRHGGNGRPAVRLVMRKTDGTFEVLQTTAWYQRCTTFIKCIDRNEALERWNQRRAMEGFARNALEMEARIISSADNDNALDGVWLEARRLGGAEMLAARGTAMHRVAEWYDLGSPPPILPPAYEKGLQGWINLTRFFQWREIEKFMVHDGLKVAGTPDRVGKYHPCENCGREYYIVDLKTGRVDLYTELQIAMQLGIYANSDYYDVHTGERRQQDDICRCKGIAVKLDIDSGTGTCYWVDIFTGWTIARDLAPLVHKARTEKGLLVPFEPTPNLFLLIEGARTREELNSLFAQYRPHWKSEHTEAGKKRLSVLQQGD